ncbi:MAG: hypothetical protein CSA58_05110 [Micrococcales bacterium]|nr:MAG: hypothetical protein CSA58_05110 [Micrococcales bacterium]
MIIDLRDTSTSAVSAKMVELRDNAGTILNRVLNLVVVVDSDTDLEDAVETAKEATREHPCRVLVLLQDGDAGEQPKLDAQIRIGGDAGASEILVLTLHGELTEHPDAVVLALLLADTPVVAWWPGDGPVEPAEDRIGALAKRRLVDASQAPDPVQRLYDRAPHDTPADTDLGWARITRWRALLAAALDTAPYEQVTEALVAGSPESPSNELLAAWLALKLKCPVTLVHTPAGEGVVTVKLMRKDDRHIELMRPDGVNAVLSQSGRPDRRVELARRDDRAAIAEELRRLDPDEVYHEVVSKGLPQVIDGDRTEAKDAAEAGLITSRAEAERRTGRAAGQGKEAGREG